jgi:hypothetical protein
MNFLRERVARSAPAWTEGAATWLDIYDDDLDAALARYESLESQATS